MNLLNKLELEMAIREQRSILPEYKELCKLMSEQMKMYFDSLIEVGFTIEQAMTLITSHGINVGRLFNLNQNDKGKE